MKEFVKNMPAELFLASIQNNSVDLVVTSPPYDDLRKYNGFSFPFEEIACQLFRVMKPGGVVVWVVADQTKDGSESCTSFRQALYFKEVAGFRLHDTMIYKKKNGAPLLNHGRYNQVWEYMFVLSKGRPKTFNPIMEKCKTFGNKVDRSKNGIDVKEAAMTRRSGTIITKEYKVSDNIFEYATGVDRSGHPAAFPQKLAAEQIYSWSNEGDLVLDPFSGHGTTGKMAIKMRRDFIGCDISKEYCIEANKNINTVYDQPTLDL